MLCKKNLLSFVRTVIIALVVVANAAVVLPLGGCASSGGKSQVSATRSDEGQAKLASDKEIAPASKHGPKHH